LRRHFGGLPRKAPEHPRQHRRATDSPIWGAGPIYTHELRQEKCKQSKRQQEARRNGFRNGTSPAQRLGATYSAEAAGTALAAAPTPKYSAPTDETGTLPS
jgi:hypothetical protein